MTDDGLSPGRVEITSSTLKTAAVYVIVCVAALGLLTVLIGPASVVPGLAGGLAFLYLPSAAAAILLCVSAVVPVIFRGRLALPLSGAISVLALTVFLSTAALAQTLAPGIGGLALPLFLTGVALAVLTLAAPFSPLARVAMTAIFAMMAGLLALSAPAAIGLPDGAALGWILFAGFIVTALTTLPAVFQGHSNEYMEFIGGYFGRREVPWVLGAACATFLVYCQYLRPVLVSAAPLGAAALEWGVIALLLVSLGVRALGFVRSISQARKPGELRTLVQAVAYDRGSLGAAQEAVDSFVDGGRKEGLIVYVTAVLLENRVPGEDIQAMIAEIVDYSDEPVPAMTIAWATGDIAGKNRKRRLALAGSLVAAAAAAINRGSAESPEPGALSNTTGGM